MVVPPSIPPSFASLCKSVGALETIIVVDAQRISKINDIILVLCFLIILPSFPSPSYNLLYPFLVYTNLVCFY